MSSLSLTAARKRYQRALKAYQEVSWDTALPTPPRSPPAGAMSFWDISETDLQDVTNAIPVVSKHHRPTTPHFFVQRKPDEEPPGEDFIDMLLTELLNHLSQLVEICADAALARAHKSTFHT